MCVPKTSVAEVLDVLIIAASLSGINAAYRVKTELPGTSFGILEGRDVVAGTWSFWKYPGFRCDSEMTTFGLGWHLCRLRAGFVHDLDSLKYLETLVLNQFWLSRNDWHAVGT